MQQVPQARSDIGALRVRAKGPHVQVVRSRDGLDEMRALWEALARRAAWASPMQHHSWTRIYAEVFGIDRELEVMLAEDSQAASIAPLRRTGGGLRRRLEFVCFHGHIDEPNDFVYAEGADVTALAQAVAGSGRPLVLRRIRADSPTLAALRRAYRGRGIVVCREGVSCPWLALDASWANPEDHVNAGRRSDLRRARRAAEKLGTVATEILAPKPEELPALLEEVYRLEAMEWKKQAGTALLCRPRLKEFYSRFAAAASAEGMLRLCFLRIGGRAAAVQYAIESANRFWLLKIGFAAEFARCSPGILLMVETIRYAARAGLRSYEFLGEDEPWIRTWTPLAHPCVSFRAYPLNVRGIAAYLAGTVARYRPLGRIAAWTER